MCDDRPGRFATAMDYDPARFKERGIRARRFRPCPHCGGIVAARERVWTPPYQGGVQATVYRRASCLNGCGWSFSRTGGTREDFVRAVNRRCDYIDLRETEDNE